MPDSVANTESRTRAIYNQLRHEILEGRIESGVPISQVQLAERLGASRTPLREALRLLEREGLIHSETNRRVEVAPLSAQDVEQLYATRIVVEALAVQLSVPHFTESDLLAMRAALDGMSLASDTQDVETWELPHSDYHELLRSRAGERVRALARELSDHSDRYRRVYLSGPLAWSSANEEHTAIVEACEARDAAAASNRLAHHLARTALTVIAMISPNHDPAPIRVALQVATGGIQQA
jgi:DNA-binding GntR family transcriptional regulator